MENVRDLRPFELIANERQRQLDVEGWTPENDDQYTEGQLAECAAGYALSPRLRNNSFFSAGRHVNHVPVFWPVDCCWWKPTPDDRIRELVKAGALIVAEIERLQRHGETSQSTPPRDKPLAAIPRQQLDAFDKWMFAYVAALENLAGRPVTFLECFSDGLTGLFDEYSEGREAGEVADDEFSAWE